MTGDTKLSQFWTIIAACWIAGASGIAEAQFQAGSLKLSREAILRYNRVEGLFAGYSVEASPYSARHLTLSLRGGYGIHNLQARWDVSLKVDKPKLSANLGLFDRTVSPNQSIVRTAENTVFALLFKGDYLDYFRARNGFEVDFRLKSSRTLSLVSYLSAFQYRSMPVDVNWTVFRNSDTFRPNPGVREGDAGIFKLGVVYDNKRKSPIFRNAWFASLLYERGFREFPYNGFAASFKRHQKTIFGRQAFVLRGFVGARESVDEQHLYDLGGIGTLRGYRIKEYTGNRALLFSVDYLFRGDLIGKLNSRLGQIVEVIAFADAGWTARFPKNANLFDGFDALRLDDIKTNVGAALSLYRQLIRFNVSRRLDGDIDDWTFSARFRREF